MALFRYEIAPVGPDAQPEAGQVEAPDTERALAMLVARGYGPERITIAEPDDESEAAEATSPSPLLNLTEAETLLAELAELSAAGLPLAGGLRALALEVGRGRLRQVLNQLAMRIEAGQSLDTALKDIGTRLPGHLQGIIASGVASGQLPELLEQYVELRRDRATLRRRMWLAIAYPLVLLVVFGLLLTAVGLFTVPSFYDIYLNFGTQLPAMTQGVFWLFGGGFWYPLGLTILVLGVFFFALFGPAPRWMRGVVYAIPVFGPFCRWGRLMPFTRLMRLFVEHNRPLPDALRLVASGLDERHLVWGCRWAAAQIESGAPFCESIAATRVFPRAMMPLLEWGERNGALENALASVDDMAKGRASIQIDFAPMSVMAIVLVVGLMVGGLVIALFMPLISLISTLTS